MAAAAEIEPTLRYADYRLVDDMPDVAHERSVVREAARQLLESRREQSREAGGEIYVPVDALSTARDVLAAGATFGYGSVEHRERSSGLVLDCSRLITEWYRKNTSEYFPALRHRYDDESRDFFSHGWSLRQITENAVVPITGKAEEEERRINERVEDETPHILRRLGKIAVGREAVMTISQCTDWAIGDYQADMRAGRKYQGYAGYVPEIEKVMIRTISLDQATGDRFEEQVGVPGTYITHEIIQATLTKQGIAAERFDKTGLHGAQILTSNDLMSFIALLDDEASEQWCTNIFMGDEVPKDFVKDYDGFRAEALRRQATLTTQAQTLATFVAELAHDGIDRRKALGMVEDFVKKMLLDIAKHDVEVAKHMFDEKTALGLREVRTLELQGRYDEAFIRMQEVEKAAPGGGFCGAGGCGLETIRTHGEAGKALLERLHAKPGDTIVRDTERACRCGSKSIVYAYNKKKVNKLCESCGAFESKISKVA